MVQKVPIRRPGSALRRSGAPLPASNIKWDEHNLEENERIKSELNPVKILEPKTPYHGPLDATIIEDEEDLGALDLDQCPSLSSGEGYQGTLNLLTTVADNLSNPPNPTTTEEKKNTFSDDEDDQDGHPHTHRQFEEARRQHYNMREALRVARTLLQKDEDDKEDPESSK
uniref:Protein phosphatase inhibitor 2 n=1 Tax=Polytomella parva TaxID=51329 RepID=A0A7S0UUU9_9CHLO|mmetsp:Transcript_1861/g.2739  ORF Transcript_1861/g.2739 Transcript_1861/m.2739 type:complete len:170 (+) Transcript_1861:67-576(+)